MLGILHNIRRYDFKNKTNLPLLNEQKYTMSPHPSSVGGCSLSSASRRARVRPLSGATYFKPQASGYCARSVDNKRVPSFSNGKSTTSLSPSFVSETWTNDMALTKRKIHLCGKFVGLLKDSHVRTLNNVVTYK